MAGFTRGWRCRAEAVEEVEEDEEQVVEKKAEQRSGGSSSRFGRLYDGG